MMSNAIVYSDGLAGGHIMIFETSAESITLAEAQRIWSVINGDNECSTEHGVVSNDVYIEEAWTHQRQGSRFLPIDDSHLSFCVQNDIRMLPAEAVPAVTLTELMDAEFAVGDRTYPDLLDEGLAHPERWVIADAEALGHIEISEEWEDDGMPCFNIAAETNIGAIRFSLWHLDGVNRLISLIIVHTDDEVQSDLNDDEVQSDLNAEILKELQTCLAEANDA